MMTPVIHGRRLTGLLAIPAFMIVLALIGMAVSTESKQDFERREGSGRSGADQLDQQGGDSADQTGSFDDARPRDGRPGQDGTDGQEAGSEQGGQPDGSRPVVIRTEGGDIVIQLDENGRPTRIVPADSVIPTDPSRVLTPDPNGGFVGFRVTEDGRLEPVQRDGLSGDDFLLRPAPGGGTDITKPDGSRVTLTPTEDGQLTGSETAADGTARDLIPDNGDIVVQPGVDFGPGLEVDPATEPIVIDAGAGPIRIELEPNGDLVANRPDPDEAVVVDPEDLSAIRVDEDGNLELVPLDQIGPDDTVLVPTGDGFDLVRPDGSRIEFRADGENDGITATEITADGQEIELTPNPDGSVTLEDGTTIGPIDVAEDGGPIEQLLDQTSDLPWPWVFAAIAALAVLSAGTAFYLHRNRPQDPFDYSQFAAQGVPRDQLEEFLTLLSADPDPARAIRLAFYAAERGLAGLPTRRANETPFEWHGRVARMRPPLADPLAPICDLFAKVRFAPGEATTQDRDMMVSHLRNLNEVANRVAQDRTAATV